MSLIFTNTYIIANNKIIEIRQCTLDQCINFSAQPDSLCIFSQE